MSNSIRVHSNTEYVIEVNDNGDTISFDTSDIGLTSRLYDTFDQLDKLAREYEVKAAELDAREDKPRSTVEVEHEDGTMEHKTLITQNQYDGTKMMDDYYRDARAALDIFLGEGACQKIFGDKNYYTMFEDLTQQLKPHFEKMGLSAQKLKANAVKKHSPNRETRRTLT